MTGRSILGVAIPQTATYDCARVELSNCFCGHCSAISIERFRRKVSFSGIAGVSKWMARRSTNTVRHSALIDAILYVYRTLDSSVFSNRFFYYIVSRNRHIIIPPIKSWRWQKALKKANGKDGNNFQIIINPNYVWPNHVKFARSDL